MTWQRIAREDGLPADMLKLLQRGWLFSLLAVVAWIVFAAALVSSLSTA